MIEIARKLRIDLDLAQRSSFYYVPGFSGFDTSNCLGYSWDHPAFTGFFKDSMGLFLDGLDMDLPIRVDYVWTPEWPNFDPHLGRVILLGAAMSVNLSVRAHQGGAPESFLMVGPTAIERLKPGGSRSTISSSPAFSLPMRTGPLSRTGSTRPACAKTCNG